MPASDVLKNFRKGGYDGKPEEKTDSPESPRTFKLTDDELKELQGYAKGPGAEQECLVTGRVGQDGEFSVTSVHSPDGGGKADEGEMAKEMMGMMGNAPITQNQTMPSPS